MDRDWESTFKAWAKPPGQTEQTKCENAERAARKAIEASPALNNRDITVFAQGSYRNRTNVRADSDVDICVLCRDSFFFKVPEGTTPEDFDIHTPADYPYPQYKRDIEQALVSFLGRGAVTRGKKAINVHENTYRVDADAVACFEYRRYRSDGRNLVGTAFLPEDGGRIVNWPEQNYENGVAKNEATGRRFKALVRILKHLRNEMAETSYKEAKHIPSFLIECLVWNVPNDGFGHDTYTADVQWTLAHLFNQTRKFEDCKEWGEINELKYLFRTSQPWTLEQANTFLWAAWNYIGFE